MPGQNIRAFHKLGISLASLPAGFGVACLLLAATAVGPATDTFKTLANFNGSNGADPALESLVQGTDGNLYGTTQNYGAHSGGTVFKMTPNGLLTTIHNFAGSPDGAYPQGGLVMGNAGNFFWGTTSVGGAFGLGTVFRIDSAGVLIVYHSFGGTDGQYPESTLVEGTDNNFYGTTEQGGAHGDGTVFKITSGGTLTTLYSFAETDGKSPYAALVQAADGNFYGTTEEGGANHVGTIFEITSAGTLTTLYSFARTDGTNPYAPLVQGTDGNFYGTTADGGDHRRGTVFQITSAGALTTLHSFDIADGDNPIGGLVQRTAGGFFGVTSVGGSGVPGFGTVFSLAIGLGPFVKTLPTSGAVGSSVIILGTDLTGSTSVTFNGTAATFTVVSSSEITTTVPSGATTGPVEVDTPSETLTSNVNFTVP